MSPPGVSFSSGGRKLVERVLAHRLEHPVPGLAARPLVLLEEASIDELLERLGRGITHRGGGGSGAPSGKDAEGGDELPISLVEQLVAPVDGRPQRPLPRGRVARPAREHLELPSQARDELIEREEAKLGGGELDRERQSVERSADRSHGVRIGARELEAVRGSCRPRDEQRDGLRACQFLDVALAGGWYSQRGHRVDVLAREIEPRATRREDGETGGCREQGAYDGTGRIDLLEVVEHEHEDPPPERRGRGVDGEGSGLVSPQRGHDRRRDELVIRER